MLLVKKDNECDTATVKYSKLRTEFKCIRKDYITLLWAAPSGAVQHQPARMAEKLQRRIAADMGQYEIDLRDGAFEVDSDDADWALLPLELLLQHLNKVLHKKTLRSLATHPVTVAEGLLASTMLLFDELIEHTPIYTPCEGASLFETLTECKREYDALGNGASNTHLLPRLREVNLATVRLCEELADAKV